MAYYARERTRGVGAAAAIHLSVYCAVAGCLAYGLHALFEPTQLANPGVAAYKPPPQTVINYLPARPQGAPEPVIRVVEPPPEPLPEPAATASTPTKPAPAATEKRTRAAKAEQSRRTRSARVRRDPRMDYAHQPFFWGGGFRPWY